MRSASFLICARGRSCARLLRRALAILVLLAPALTSAQDVEPGTTRGGVFLRIADDKPIELYKDSYALVIGASQYRGGWPLLPGVKEDVAAVRETLKKHGFKVGVAFDPTLQQLDRVFSEFINNYGLNADNRLLFYFAGHGHTMKSAYGEEMGYLVPVDAPEPNRDPAGFLKHAMPMQQIEAFARRIQARHALFIFDSCFSGSIFSITRAAPSHISYQAERPVRQFITSGEASETVPDKSTFRRQFVAALEGEGDSDADGYVTGEELGRFLQNTVINYTRNAQHPQYGKIRHPDLDKGDFIFELRPAQASAPAPSAGRGTLFLNSLPQSSIRVNGKQIEAFPARDVPIAAGRHTLTFVTDRDGRLEKRVEVRPGETHRCTAFFARGEIECRTSR